MKLNRVTALFLGLVLAFSLAALQKNIDAALAKDSAK